MANPKALPVVTPEQVQQVIDYAQKVVSDRWVSLEYTFAKPPKVYAEMGNRYCKLIIHDDDGKGASRSVYGFIDMTNGDLLKAASWKAPERNYPRGNVIQGKLDCCGWCRIS